MESTLFRIATDTLTEATSIAMAEHLRSSVVSLGQHPIKTIYAQQGSGDPLILLLHGFDSSVFEFRRLLPLLAPQNQALAVDLLGFGFTERPDGLDVNPSTIEQHLYSFWKAKIQKPVVLVGASMGGAAAIAFALAFPNAVEKLVLIDSAGYGNGPRMGQFLTDSIGYWVTERFLKTTAVRQRIGEKAYYRKAFASVDAQRCAALHLSCSNWSKALISFTRSGGYRSYKARLSEIQVPTLILWGEKDRILGTKDAQKFQWAIPQSQLIWIPECGHVPHLEQAELTARHILKFVG